MPNQTQLAYKIPTFDDSLSSCDALPTTSNDIVIESDRFNQEWIIARPSTYDYTYKIKYAKTKKTLWFDNMLFKLNYLLNLPNNWDTYGANKIDVDSAIITCRIIEELINKNLPEPSIVPIPDGGIQLEWHLNSANLEISIQYDSTTEYYSYHDLNKYEEKESEFKFNGIIFPEDFNQCIDIFMKYIGN